MGGKDFSYVDEATTALTRQVKEFKVAFVAAGSKIAGAAAYVSSQANAAEPKPVPQLANFQIVDDKTATLGALKNRRCPNSKCQASDYLFEPRLEAKPHPFRGARMIADNGAQVVFDTRWN